MASSIISAFEATVNRKPDVLAVRYRDNNQNWASQQWQQMNEKRRIIAAALLSFGLPVEARVCILSNTSLDWVLADLGAVSVGAITVPIYQNSTADECLYVIENSEASWIFVENKEQLSKLQEFKDKATKLLKVVVFSDETDGTDWTISWTDFLKLGEQKLQEYAAQLDERTQALSSESIYTIIYTSGTTGRPKGVVLTHGNILSTANGALATGVLLADDIQLVYLPMAHVFARLVEIAWLSSGHEIAFDVDTKRLLDNMKEIRPTIVASVPRVFEKVYAKVVAKGTSVRGPQRHIFRWALKKSDEYAECRAANKKVSFRLRYELALAKLLVFNKIHRTLSKLFGGRIRCFVSGGAPLSVKIAGFFESASILVLQGYGLTETSAASAVGRLESNRLGTVGKALPNCEIKIAEDGEVMIKSTGVMRGYWKRPDATAEVLRPDGWFLTGDIGEIDSDGNLQITDRKKDIIVTAGGKNVAPQNIESLVKAANPLAAQVVVYGDKRKFLVCLLTLDPDMVLDFGVKRSIEGGFQAVCRSEELRSFVEETMEQVNANLARYETIKAFHILDSEFVVGEELTPSMKVKRKYCNQKYKAVFDSFYAEVHD